MLQYFLVYITYILLDQIIILVLSIGRITTVCRPTLQNYYCSVPQQICKRTLKNHLPILQQLIVCPNSSKVSFRYVSSFFIYTMLTVQLSITQFSFRLHLAVKATILQLDKSCVLSLSVIRKCNKKQGCRTAGAGECVLQWIGEDGRRAGPSAAAGAHLALIQRYDVTARGRGSRSRLPFHPHSHYAHS